MASTMIQKCQKIQEILDETIGQPEIPLVHSDAYTLLIAVLLSAQCTDVRVNLVTPQLFAKARTPQQMVKLSVDEIREIIRPCGLSPQKAKAIHGLSQLLLDRHGASTQPFGLETAGELETDRYRFVGYRFTTEFGRPDVKQWWEKNKATLAPEPVPTP